MASRESDEEFLSGLREKHATWTQHWQGLHADPPPVLYHYTDASGFLGIVESRDLWASNAAYLNDSTELTYIRDVLADVVSQLQAPYREKGEEAEADAFAFSMLVGRIAGTPGALAQSWAARTISLLDRLPGISGDIFEVYVSCFCTDGDLLSQWRGYPSAGGGYALGFRSRTLGYGFGMLRRVIYDPDVQRQLLHDLLAPIGEAIAAKSGTEDDAKHYSAIVISKHLGAIAASLLECGFCFKHPKFQEESEWRWVVLHPPAQKPAALKPLVRATQTGLLPYVRRPLRPDEPGNRPIAEIIVGPGAPPKLAADAATQLLKSAGYENASDIVAHSAVPLRV